MGNNKLGTMKPLRLVLSMALPIMLSMSLQAVYNIADSLFIAKYSEEAFAGVSIIQPLFLAVLALGNGIAAGEGSLLSKCLGERNDKRAVSSVGTAWTIAMISATVSSLFVILINRSFVEYFLDGDFAISEAVRYLYVVALSFPFVFVASLISFILQSHGMSKSSMVIQSSGAIVNIILDPIFIFTLDMGAFGAGLATAIGFSLSAIIALILYFKSKCTKSRFSFSALDGKRIFQIALPSMLAQAAGPIVGVVLNKLIVSYGIGVMAVYGMYIKMESFMFLAASGIGSALIVIVGYNYGMGDYKRVKKCFFTSLALSWSVMILGFIFFQLFSPWLVSVFTEDAELIALGTRAFRSLCFCFLLTSPNIIMTGLLQGLGLGTKSLKITYSRFFIFLIPLAFLLNYLWGINGLWFAYFAADVPTVFLLIKIFKNVNREYLSN